MPKIWIAHDVGKCINPVLVMGQVEGSVYMGLGEALMEEMAYRTDANAQRRAQVPVDARVQEPDDAWRCPRSMTYLVEDPDANGPFGAKEVGQGPLLPIPPAVANAVYDAVGVRVDEVPITPGEDPEGAQGEGRRASPRASARRAFPTCRIPTPLHVPHARGEGGDGGRGRAMRAGRAAMPRPECESSDARHDAPAAVPLLRADDA